MRKTTCLTAIVVTLTAAASFAGDVKDAALRKRWEASMRDFNIPGATVVAVRADEVLLVQPMGLRDVAGNKPVTADTAFYIASCTKSFMAMLATELAEDGKLNKDTPVRKYLPQFAFADDTLSQTMTVRDLLCHKYGLDSDHITFAEAYSGQITDEMFYRLLKTEHAKGSFQYSNLHYTILGRVVQQVTGKPWKDALAERVLEPAGMTRTTAYASKLYGFDDVALPHAYSASGTPSLAPLRKTDRTMHAAGGMGASGNDLARWLRLNLGGGEIDGKRIVSQTGCAEMQKLTCPDRSTRKILSQHVRLGYGLGWQIGELRGRKIVQHNGGYSGAAAHVSFLPEQGFGVAVVANTDGPAGGWVDIIASEVYDRLLDVQTEEDVMAKFKRAVDEARQHQPPPISAGENPAKASGGLSAAPDKYVGTYVHPTLGQAAVEFADGKLRLALGDIRPELISTGADKFKTSVRGAAVREGAFEVAAGGEVTALHLTLDDNEEARFDKR
jgi:CubicO group peptidase (beta-lactamase class C family)